MTPLDPDRRKAAMGRARLALRDEAHHVRQARAARAKADTLCRTWGLHIVSVDDVFDVLPEELVDTTPPGV